MTTKTTSIRIPEEILEEIDEKCQKDGICRNDFIKNAIESALEDSENENHSSKEESKDPYYDKLGNSWYWNYNSKKQISLIRDESGSQRKITMYKFDQENLKILTKKYGISLPLDHPIYGGQSGQRGNSIDDYVNHVDHQKKDDEWETPPELYHSLCRKHKIQPEFDTACTTSNCKCKLGYYSDKGIDGLSLAWDKPVWCNPPHSETEKWVRRAYSQWKQHNISILMIIPANSMSSNYWHDCIEGKAEIAPIPGRIRFLKDGKPSEHYSRNAYVCIIWRKEKQCCTEGEGV